MPTSKTTTKKKASAKIIQLKPAVSAPMATAPMPAPTANVVVMPSRPKAMPAKHAVKKAAAKKARKVVAKAVAKRMAKKPVAKPAPKKMAAASVKKPARVTAAKKK